MSGMRVALRDLSDLRQASIFFAVELDPTSSPSSRTSTPSTRRSEPAAGAALSGRASGAPQGA